MNFEQNIFKENDCCVFKKTKEKFGGLSNMAAGFNLKVNNVPILTTEALYQVCRFPHLPMIQTNILKQKSPMAAKMVGKPFRSESRPDWEEVKVDIMRWCLKVKLAQNYFNFSTLLDSTKDFSIVEDSNKDDFWGAIRTKQDKGVLKGRNILGQLLEELRLFYRDNRNSMNLFVVEPLAIPDFKLLGKPILQIDERSTIRRFKV